MREIEIKSRESLERDLGVRINFFPKARYATAAARSNGRRNALFRPILDFENSSPWSVAATAMAETK